MCNSDKRVPVELQQSISRAQLSTACAQPHLSSVTASHLLQSKVIQLSVSNHSGSSATFCFVAVPVSERTV